MKFDFHFGKKKTTVYDYAVIGFILSLLRFFALNLGATEENFMSFVDEVNRKFIKNDKLNDFIIRDDTWIESRISVEVDNATESYLDLTGDSGEVIIDSPTFTEEVDGEFPLGGDLRLTAPYETDYEL